MSFQVFISYARDDDTVVTLPGQVHRAGEEALGFASNLKLALEQTFLHMRPRPTLFFDNAVSKSEQFEPRFEKEIDASDALLVVLSSNWLERPNCRKELDLFKKRWGNDARNRIVIALKHHIDPDDRLDLLQGQDTYKFFAPDNLRGPGHFKNFFDPRGEVSGGFLERVIELAEDLRSRAERKEKQRAPQPQPSGSEPPAPAEARTAVFLAKPAPDMKPSYSRIAEELGRKGYRVVPDPAEQIPYDGGAHEFIDAALQQAEVSIHLLGEDEGSAPADSDRIVRMQLARAALRPPPFHRVIWAPKLLIRQDGAPVEERDSMNVLTKFGGYQPEDKVDDSEESRFIDFLIQHLQTSKAPAAIPERAALLHPSSRVFVYYCTEDEEYAQFVAAALDEMKIEALLAANDEGDRLTNDDLNRKRLAQCDALIGCWGKVTEARVFAALYRYLEWPELQREGERPRRVMIAAPPDQSRKKFYVRKPPRTEVDMVLDLTGESEPTPKSLGPLVGPEPAA